MIKFNFLRKGFLNKMSYEFKKIKVADIEKAIHYLQMILERDYKRIPMTEAEEYRNAGITKEQAERTYPPQNSWGMIKPAETSGKDWVEGYNEWKKGCPHN